MTTLGTSTTATSVTTTYVHKVYIRASAQRIWDAITQPEWTARYGYTGLVDSDFQPGSPYLFHPTPEFKAEAEAGGFAVPDPIIDGVVVEADAPHRLVTTWRMLMDPTTAEEPFTRLTQEIAQIDADTCSLTVTHECEDAPATLAMVSGAHEESGGGGGHTWELSDLKTLLETGERMSGWSPGSDADQS